MAEVPVNRLVSGKSLKQLDFISLSHLAFLESVPCAKFTESIKQREEFRSQTAQPCSLGYQMPGFIPLLIWTWHLQAQTAQGMYKVARRLADQAESLSPGPQGRQDQLAGVQVKGDVAGLRLRQPQLLQDPSRQFLYNEKTAPGEQGQRLIPATRRARRLPLKGTNTEVPQKTQQQRPATGAPLGRAQDPGKRKTTAPEKL